MDDKGRERRMSWLTSNLGLDTVLGLGLGAAAVWYLWNKLDDWTETPAPPRSDRKFTEEDLSIYDGKDNRLCFVAIGEEVFDVSKDKQRFLHVGGKRADELKSELAEIKQKFYKVGELVIPKPFTRESLAEFNGRNGKPVYVAVKGNVYQVDAGFYGPDGPYGIMAGKDATRALALVSLDPADIENPNIDDLKSSDLSTLEEWIAKFEMKYTRVGFLTAEDASAGSDEVDYASAVPFLNKQRQQVVLDEKIVLSHDTRLFRFKLPQRNMKLGLPIGKHIKIWCPNPEAVKEGEWNGRPDPEAGKKEIERKYTPSSLDSEKVGFFDVVIKVYKRGVIERFPDGGKMSQYMDQLVVGDKIDMAGPFGLIEYQGKSVFNIRRKEKTLKNIGMLAGGTGITPMLQLIKAVLQDPDDETKMSLIFANQTEDDILVRDMLEEQANKHPGRFRLHYTLDRPPEKWDYSTGFINEDMIKKYMPPPSDDTVIFMCGPPPMVEYACKANLTKLGYPKEAQVEF